MGIHEFSDAMIIEFTGIPGSGKSTLLPVVKDVIEERGLIALSRQEAERRCARRSCVGRAIGWIAGRRATGRLEGVLYAAMALSAFRFAAHHPRLAWHVVSSQWRRPAPWRGRLKRWRSFFGMAARYELFRNHLEPREVVVLDEGLAHQAVNLYASEADPPPAASLCRYVNYLPALDSVIEVRAELESCLRRISVRGAPNRLRGRSEGEVERFLAHAASVLEAVSRGLAERGDKITAVENSGLADSRGAGLRRNIDKVLRASTRPRLGLVSFIRGGVPSFLVWENFLS